MKLNFKHSPFSSLLSVIAIKPHFWPKNLKNLEEVLNLTLIGQKWGFKAITDKSEENGLCLKFNFTSSRVSQKFLRGLLIP